MKINLGQKKVFKFLKKTCSFERIKKPAECNHDWKEFGESNLPFEDKVFYCKTCGTIGYPRT